MSFRSVATLTLAAAVLSGSACGGKSASTTALPSALNAAAPLLGSITGAIPGLSQAQAALGAGSLLGLAKAKMPAGQFSQVAGAIPGADALMSEAVKQGAPSSPGGLSSITSFLSKSGISADQVKQIGGVLGQAIGSKVPADVASAFASALM